MVTRTRVFAVFAHRSSLSAQARHWQLVQNNGSLASRAFPVVPGLTLPMACARRLVIWRLGLFRAEITKTGETRVLVRFLLSPAFLPRHLTLPLRRALRLLCYDVTASLCAYVAAFYNDLPAAHRASCARRPLVNAKAFLGAPCCPDPPFNVFPTFFGVCVFQVSYAHATAREPELIERLSDRCACCPSQCPSPCMHFGYPVIHGIWYHRSLNQWECSKP